MLKAFIFDEGLQLATMKRLLDNSCLSLSELNLQLLNFIYLR